MNEEKLAEVYRQLAILYRSLHSVRTQLATLAATQQVEKLHAQEDVLRTDVSTLKETLRGLESANVRL